MSLKKISRRQEKLKRKPWIIKQILIDIRKRRFLGSKLSFYLERIRKKENFELSNKLNKTIAFAKKS